MDLKALNNKQKEAVEKIGGPILVFAGAGSGKTRVLTHKIAYLIEKVGLPAKNILAVTFTNKAAQEMKSRIVDLVNIDISGISIGTFHSISAQLLRREISKIGYTNDFVIYDQQDSRVVVKNIIKDLNLDLKQFDPKTFQIKISNAKNNMNTSTYFEHINTSIFDEKFYLIYREYENVLKKNNAVDFDDLLILPLKIFKAFPDCLKFYQKKYQYVLVDEYQDTNKPQFEFIHSISSKHKDIFVVGDDDQSIYGWRGADVSNILNFKEVFGIATIIKLEQNYRSTKTILEAAWNVVAKNINRAEKKLWTNNPQGEKIELIRNSDERAESKEVLNRILKLNDNFNEIAILYRTNSQSRTIEDELRKAAIPYHIIGGTKFYDRKEIKDVLAYMKIIVNPKDNISFDRIINFPTRGIGKTSLEKIHLFAKENNISCYDALERIKEVNLSDSQKNTILLFVDLLKIYKNRLLNEFGSVVVKDLLKELNLKSYYLNKNTSESLDRWDNIEELISSIEEFEQSKKNNTLSLYLEEVSLLTDIDNWNSSNNAITLMTVHSSKGLEFDNIYIMGMEDGLFPILRTLEDNDIEEERRLFYVGLTRSRQQVTLSYAKTRRKFGGEPMLSIKSRFLEDIPEDLLKSDINIRRPLRQVITNNQSLKSSLQKGVIVHHDVFGKGKVINIEGVGDNSKLTILFSNNITKKLILKYANLTIGGETI